MRERAMLIGGEIALQGAPGKGTTMTLRVPLDRQPPKTAAPE
jgi:signal transduction histidine kinase